MKILGIKIPGTNNTSAKLPAATYYKDSAGNHVYKLTDKDFGEFRSCFTGGYSEANMISLFESIPEVFAPIDAIATRVANGVFQLRKKGTDEIVYDNKAFNRLTSMPNWRTTWYKYVYNSVVYKYVCGNRYFHPYVTSSLKRSLDNISALWLLSPQYTEPIINNYRPDIFKATVSSDVVKEYKYSDAYGNTRTFTPDEVYHDAYLQFSLVNNNPLLGMGILRVNEYPMSNLIAVYQARNVIYVKRGALGMFVSKKSDESGSVALTPGEKKAIRDEYNNTHGLIGGKDPIGISEAPIDFIRIAMSIEEMQPFEETYASAAAICTTCGVPRSFIPTKEAPTYNNGPADERKLYQDVVMKEGQAFSQIHDKLLNLDEIGCYMYVDYSHIAALQDDKAVEATTNKVKAEMLSMLYEKNFITKNALLVGLGLEEIPTGNVYASDGKNPDPMAVKLGVGGTQAFQSILLAQLPPDVKKNSLVLLFGISDQEAAKLVSNEAVTTPQNTSA